MSISRLRNVVLLKDLVKCSGNENIRKEFSETENTVVWSLVRLGSKTKERSRERGGLGN